jgi:hypothetical protein
MNTKQTPFIILASQRTGSTYLAQLLNSHPNIISYSEVFHGFGILWGIGGKRMRDVGWRFLLRNLFPVASTSDPRIQNLFPHHCHIALSILKRMRQSIKNPGLVMISAIIAMTDF